MSHPLLVKVLARWIAAYNEHDGTEEWWAGPDEMARHVMDGAAAAGEDHIADRLEAALDRCQYLVTSWGLPCSEQERDHADDELGHPYVPLVTP